MFILASLLGCDADGQFGGDTGVSDTGTAETSSDTSSENDGGVVCDGACDTREWTACTCAPEDPCGFAGDHFCDIYCIERGIVETMFDDSEDCEGDCSGLCLRGVYTSCTCSPDDPCAWGGDDTCDDYCVTSGLVEQMFDDSQDCDENTSEVSKVLDK